MRLIDADEIKYREQLEWFGNGRYEPMQFVYESDIDIQPTVDAVPVVHGLWKYDNQYHWYRACCSECGYCRVTDVEADRWNEWKFCPNCGARMDGDPNGFNDETVQSLKDATEGKNLSKIYETLDDMYADMDEEE